MTLANFIKSKGHNTCIAAAKVLGVSLRTLANWYADSDKREQILTPLLEQAAQRRYDT